MTVIQLPLSLSVHWTTDVDKKIQRGFNDATGAKQHYLVVLCPKQKSELLFLKSPEVTAYQAAIFLRTSTCQEGMMLLGIFDTRISLKEQLPSGSTVLSLSRNPCIPQAIKKNLEQEIINLERIKLGKLPFETSYLGLCITANSLNAGTGNPYHFPRPVTANANLPKPPQ